MLDLNCSYFPCATYIIFGKTDVRISYAFLSLCHAMLYSCAVEGHSYNFFINTNEIGVAHVHVEYTKENASIRSSSLKMNIK